MEQSQMVKKWKVALFLNSGTEESPVWTRIRKSTAFDLAMNPETQEYDYIADESPTTELLKYKPSLSQSLTMYKGEQDYEFVFGKFYGLKTGSDAKSQVLICFYQEPLDETEPHKVFKAWRSSCVIACNNLNSVDSTLTFDINFGGTVSKGYVTVTGGTPEFTEGEYTA